MIQEEKRRFIRMDSLYLVNYQVINREGMETICSMGRTLNVSENGLKFETIQSISKDDTLRVTVGVEDDIVEVTGKVRHCEKISNFYTTGIEFSDISDDAARLFIKYRVAKLMKSQLLMNEYRSSSIH